MNQRQMDQPALADMEKAASDIVTRAAHVLREKLRGEIAVEFKDKHERDPVTAVDRAVEALVRDELRQRFPDHGVLGEEGTGEGIDGRFVWVLDPLDGTANFAAGLPFFGLSLALLRDGEPVVGCLYLPYWPGPAPAVLSASLGNGARIGGEAIRLENRPFRPGGPVAVPPGLRMMFQSRGEFAKRPGEARNLGSIVAEIAMVATGGFQYAVFAGPKLWDVAAGVVIVREAGGRAFGWDGRRWRQIGRFRAPRTKPGEKPKTLRDWSRPVLVTTPGAARHVASGLSPHRAPTATVRWLLRRRRHALDWLRRARRGQFRAPKKEAPASTEPGPRPGPGEPGAPPVSGTRA